MAIWQLTLKLIPRKKIKDKQCSDPIHLKQNEIDKLSDWEGYFIKKTSLEKLAATLKPTKSWSNDIKQFGSTDKTCLELFYQEGILHDVCLRLDLRNLKSEEFVPIVHFLQANDVFLLTSDCFLIEPTIKNLIDAIKNSKACSFVQNPILFFESLVKEP